MKQVRATVSFNGMTCFLCLYSIIVTLPCKKNTLHLQMELLCIHRHLARHIRHETNNLGSNANILLFHKMTGRNPAVDFKAKKHQTQYGCMSFQHLTTNVCLSRICLNFSPHPLFQPPIEAPPTYQLSTHSFGKT